MTGADVDAGGSFTDLMEPGHAIAGITPIG
jgi:hypothetical protein